MTYHSTARRHVRVDGIQLFLREAAPRHAPVPLLRHGYPGSVQFAGRRTQPHRRSRTLAGCWRPRLEVALPLICEFLGRVHA